MSGGTKSVLYAYRKAFATQRNNRICSSKHPSVLASRGILEGGACGFVTDGLYPFNLVQGLGMLWSALGEDMAYLQVAAYSPSGNILDPWKQDSEPIYTSDGGHGMCSSPTLRAA